MKRSDCSMDGAARWLATQREGYVKKPLESCVYSYQPVRNQARALVQPIWQSSQGRL